MEHLKFVLSNELMYIAEAVKKSLVYIDVKLRPMQLITSLVKKLYMQGCTPMEVSKHFIYMYTVYESEIIAGLDNHNKFSQVTLHLQRLQHIKFTCT